MKPVFIAAVASLVLTEVVTLGVAIWFTVKQRKHQRLPPTLSAGQDPRIAVATTRRQKVHGYAHVPHYLFKPSDKWTVTPAQLLKHYAIVLFVDAPNIAPPSPELLLQRATSTHAGVLYTRVLGVNLLAKLHGAWKAHVQSNVTPAWWTRLLVADTRVVVFTRNYPANATLIPQFMKQYGVSNDALVFGYLFSTLTHQVAPVFE